MAEKAGHQAPWQAWWQGQEASSPRCICSQEIESKWEELSYKASSPCLVTHFLQKDHILKVSQLPQIAPPSRDQVFKDVGPWEILYMQTTTPCTEKHSLRSDHTALHSSSKCIPPLWCLCLLLTPPLCLSKGDSLSPFCTKHTQKQIHIVIYTYVHKTHIHTYVQTHGHTQICTHKHIHTYKHTYGYTHIYKYTYIHIHTNTNTYACIYKHTHKHIHTYTYTLWWFE